MPQFKSISIVVSGRVQGVFFRDFIQRHAVALGLTGYVQNSSRDKSVRIYAEGPEKELGQLLEYARVGPRTAKVEDIIINWSEYTGQYTNYEVRL